MEGGKRPCPFLEQEKDRAFPSFFVALVVIIRFDLGHPSDIVQLWIGLTLVTHTLLEFLAPITHPRLSGEMWLKSVPYEKEPQPTSILLFKLVRETQAWRKIPLD